MQPVARQLQQFEYNNRNGDVSLWSVPRSYFEDNWATLLVGSLAGKGRLLGWCEMAAGLGVSWEPAVEFRSCQSSGVLYGRLWRQNLSAWSWRLSTVRSRCQGTADKDTAGWKRLIGCCDDLWSVKISGGAVITCSSEWWVQVVKKIHSSTHTPSTVTHKSWQYYGKQNHHTGDDNEHVGLFLRNVAWSRHKVLRKIF
jgi:hypothetical protein